VNESRRVDSFVTDFAAYGLENPAGRLPKSDDYRKTNRNPLVDHPAVTSYRGKGVDTDDLTSFIESFASLRAGRVRSVGHSQYAHSKGQKFESFTPADNVRELIEELADASNYIDFLAIKLLNFAYTMDKVAPDCD